MLIAFGFRALANPTGLTVSFGSAVARQTGSQLSITAGNNAVLNWQNFNIAPGETTVFNQPSATSIVWNRVNDPNPSQIFGTIQANGVVVLLNSSGFYFGPNSFVSAAGLVVSTANCAPPQNAGGSWVFNGPPPLASIVNYGHIQVGQAGSAFLIADQIENHGDILAPGGNIGLAAGQTVTLSERPDGRGMSMQVMLPQGSVNNYGNLIADAGTIALNAKVVNQNGFIQANSVQNQNGIIELVASDALNLGANSHISAEGDDSAAGSAGGSVTLKSGNVFSDAAGSSIVTAGGANGGNGGDVEVSAPNIDSLNSSMNGSAAADYRGGEFLLDPANIILGTSGAGVADGSGTVAYNSGSGTLNINVNQAFKNKNFSQILLQATGNITLNAGVTWNLYTSTGNETAGTLTLEAGGNIVFGSGSLLTDANGWMVNLLAGVSFPSGAVRSGIGNIYLNGSNGGAGSGSIQLAQGSVNLSAGNSIQLGSGYVRTVAGGNITLNGGNSFSSSSGNVETGGSPASPTGAGGNIYLAAGSFSIGGQIANRGTGGLTLYYGGSSLNVGSIASHLISSRITLESKNDILLPYNLNWNLSDSTGLNQGQLTLEAGGNVGFQYDSASLSGATIFDANNWSLAIFAGVVNFTTPIPTVIAGTGTISFFDEAGQIFASNGDLPSGRIQTASGNITLVAGQDINMGSGVVNTTGGGSINAHALAGSIDTGSYAQGYIIQPASSASQGYIIDSGYGIGGISTLAGGNVNLTAGSDVTSVLPANNGYYYYSHQDGRYDYVPTGTTDGTAGSGAYGSQPGNVTIVAGGNVTGHYLVANGTGGIFAGVNMDANGNPVVDGAGKYVLGGSGSAGTDLSSPNLALSLINGGWNVTAAQNIILQEIRNPNGVFNIYAGAANHAFDYGLNDYVNLMAGNLVQLGASSSLLPRLNDSDGVPVPFIYPSILNVTAGAGGVTLVGDDNFNQLILYPSPQGSLTINTTGGGSLAGSLPATAGAPQIYNLVVSDGDPGQYFNGNLSLADVYGLNGHAAAPIHLGSPTPISINVSGDLNQVFLVVPEAAQINVVGNINNSRFQGMNLNASDITIINVGQSAKNNMENLGLLNPATDGHLAVGGDINNRGAFTSIDLSQIAGAQMPNLALLAQAITPQNAPSPVTLLTSFYYDPTTKILTYQDIPGTTLASVLQLLQHLSIQVYQNGVPQWADPPYNTIPITATVSVINAETAQALQTKYTSLGATPSGTYGYAIGGGGKFEITARNVDLGTTAGIQSFGAGYYRNASGYPLAGRFTTGADILVNLTGDLTMYSTAISSLNGGNIYVNADGNINVGSSDFSVNSFSARGIYTTGQGNVAVYAGGNIDVNGSRIAAYDVRPSTGSGALTSGGSATVVSRNGNINAGNGNSGFVIVSSYLVDSVTHQVTALSQTIPGSGILETSYTQPGNILVEAPHGTINAGAGGIMQLLLDNPVPPETTLFGLPLNLTSLADMFRLALDGRSVSALELEHSLNGIAGNSTVSVYAGYELQQFNGGPALVDSFGNPVVNADNLSAGTLVKTSDNQNIDANGSGVIGAGTVNLNASGGITGNIFALGNVNLDANKNINVSVLGLGTVSVASAGGSVSGTIIGIGGVSASGSAIDANLESNGSVSGSTSGEKGLAAGTAADATANATAASDDSAKAAKKTDDSGGDDLLKKKKGIALAQKISRVTVLLPQKY